MDRRAFLKFVIGMSGGACAASFLSGCQPARQAIETAGMTPSPFPTETPSAMPALTSESTPTVTLEPSPTASSLSTRVALIKTDDRASGVQRALSLLDQDGFQGKRMLVKPNYNSAHEAPGSTDNQVLVPTIQWLRSQGVEQITIGDRSGMGDTRAVMDDKGIFALADEYGFDTLIFDDLQADDWIKVEFASSHWPDGFRIARPVLEADGVVSLCCLKTHRFGGHFTLSLKNSVGMVAKTVPGDPVDYMSDILHNSPFQRELIADINTAYSPDLILLDGIDAFTNGGPEQGKKEHPGVILAGTDRVAIDAVGVSILRYYGTTPEVQKGLIFAQPQLARAVALGLGVDSPEKIEFITEDAESQLFAEELRGILAAG